MKNIKLLVATLLVTLTASAQFTQKALPYAYNALEPFVDAQTMEIHYSKHHAAYVKNLNTALAGTADEKLSLNEIFAKISTMPAAVRNNGGGHYNHELFWSVLTPEKNTKMSAELEKAINETFGSLDGLKEKLNAAGASRFGSGWAWLVEDENQDLKIVTTSNAANPLTQNLKPILVCDVWEHAYYIDVRNARPKFLENFWKLVNWNFVEENLA